MDRLAALRGTMEPEEEENSTEEPVADSPAAQTARLDIVLEKKGRAGKCATIVCGFTLPDSDVSEIASALKRRLGVGGSARGGEILIQGDRRADVLAYLRSQGFKARVI